jgi:hypothetical protein
MPALESRHQSPVRFIVTQPEGAGAEHDLSAVAVRQESIPDGDRLRSRGIAPAEVGRGTRTRSGLDAVGDRREQRLLVLDVPVQRTRLDIELGPEASHGQVGESDLVEEAQSGVDDRRAIMAGCGASRTHGPTIVNTVQVNAVQCVTAQP